MNFVKFSRKPFLQNTSGRILLFLIYLPVSFCKDVLYICSNLLLLKKATKTHKFGIFSFCKCILYLYCECILTIDQKISTRNHVSLRQEYSLRQELESFYKKRKKVKKENQKVANRKLGKVGNLGNLGKVISSFLVSEFSTWPLNNHRKDVNRQNAPLVDQHFKLPKHNFTGYKHNFKIILIELLGRQYKHR